MELARRNCQVLPSAVLGEVTCNAVLIEWRHRHLLATSADSQFMLDSDQWMLLIKEVVWSIRPHRHHSGTLLTPSDAVEQFDCRPIAPMQVVDEQHDRGLLGN